MTRIERPAAVPDAAEILNSIGEVAYEWRLDTDALLWSDNVESVFGVSAADIGSGRSFAQKVDDKDGQSRHDAVNRAAQGDTSGGVAYQVQYAFRRDPSAQPVWLEDIGRWFAAPDGKPMWAHGVVREISERHARESELLKLAKFDPLTGEMNRARLTTSVGTKPAIPYCRAYRAASAFHRAGA